MTYDPWNAPVRRGEFAFRSRGGNFIRVVPCMGSDNILKIARGRISERATKRLARIVLCYDPDVELPETTPGIDVVRQRVQALAQEYGGVEADGAWLVDETALFMVCWHAPDSRSAGLPDRQTLERIICSAVVAAYSPRGEWVQQWLDGRPNGPSPGQKLFCWSYFAGWYAHHGAEDFYHHIWKDELVARELDARLGQMSGWTAIEEMAR